MLALDALFSTGNQKWSLRVEKIQAWQFQCSRQLFKRGFTQGKNQAILVALLPVTQVYHLPTGPADKMPISLVRTEF